MDTTNTVVDPEKVEEFLGRVLEIYTGSIDLHDRHRPSHRPVHRRRRCGDE